MANRIKKTSLFTNAHIIYKAWDFEYIFWAKYEQCILWNAVNGNYGNMKETNVSTTTGSHNSLNSPSQYITQSKNIGLVLLIIYYWAITLFP